MYISILEVVPVPIDAEAPHVDVALLERYSLYCNSYSVIQII